MTLTRPSRLRQAGALLESLNLLECRWEAVWRQICEDADVHPSQARALLFLLPRGAVPMHALASNLSVAPSTATRIIEQMEKVGWVTRAADPGDRRRVLIHLLPEGEARAWTLDSLGQQRTWELCGGLRNPEQAMAILEEVGDALGRLE